MKYLIRDCIASIQNRTASWSLPLLYINSSIGSIQSTEYAHDILHALTTRINYLASSNLHSYFLTEMP